MSFMEGFSKKIPASRRVDLYGFLITLIKSGFDIQGATGEVAKTLEKQADQVILGKGELLSAAKIYRYIEQEQRQGRALHLSLAGRAPDAEVMMLMAGAEGDIINGLKAAQASAVSGVEMRKKIRKILTYPFGILMVVVFAMNWLGNNLLPVMAKLKPVSQWAPAEQTLYWATTNVGTWFPGLIFAMITIALATHTINRLVVGSVRESIHGLPPLNVIRKITAATMLSTLSSLVRAGLPVLGALLAMRDATNSTYMRYYLDYAVNNMRSGVARQGPGKAIGSKLFSPWVMVKLDIYSRASGDSFAQTMSEIAGDATTEAMSSIESLSRWINIFLMIGAAVVIGFTIITMYGSTSDMQSGLT